jgi:hypothetical protein
MATRYCGNLLKRLREQAKTVDPAGSKLFANQQYSQTEENDSSLGKSKNDRSDNAQYWFF